MITRKVRKVHPYVTFYIRANGRYRFIQSTLKRIRGTKLFRVCNLCGDPLHSDNPDYYYSMLISEIDLVRDFYPHIRAKLTFIKSFTSLCENCLCHIQEGKCNTFYEQGNTGYAIKGTRFSTHIAHGLYLTRYKGLSPLYR